MKKLLVMIILLLYFSLTFSFKNDEFIKIKDLIGNGQLKQAEAMINEAIKQEPKNDKLMYLLAQIRLNENKYDETIELLDNAIEINPKNSEYYVLLGGAYGTKINNVSVFRKAFMAPKIKNLFLKAVEVDNKNINAHFSLMQYYLFAPSIAGGGEEKALQEAKIISTLNKVQGYVAFANIYKKQNKVDKAISQYESALKLEPENENIKFNYIYILTDAKKYEEAYSLLQKVLKKDKTNQNAMYQIGKIGAVSGLYLEESKEMLENYLNIQHGKNLPSNAWANYRLGMVYENLKDTEKAKKCYLKAFKEDKDLKVAKSAYDKLN